MHILERQLSSAAAGARLPLSAALAELARQEQYLALEEPHRRYDIGARYGLLTAQLALALNGRDRADVLANLVELLAGQQLAAAAGRGPQ
jgi:UTP--glucose-1-phosphate uridylyltransferase